MAAAAGSVRTYILVYITLLGLTALTVALNARLGPWEVPVTLGIAATKTLLVGWFFMHLNHASKLTWLVVAAGVLFLVIMITLTMSDYMTRGWVPRPASPIATRNPSIPGISVASRW